MRYIPYLNLQPFVYIQHVSETQNNRTANSRKFLDALTKLRRATISFVMSVRPSVRMEQLGSYWTDFDEI